MKVLIVGMIFSRNLGDGVIYHSLKTTLENFDVSVVGLDTAGLKNFSTESPAESKVKMVKTFLASKLSFIYRIAATFGNSSKNRSFLLEAENKIRDVDAVIIGGGQLLTNLTETLPERLNSVSELCLKYNKPYAIFGCGVGKSFTSKGKQNYIKLINSADYIAVRGKDSKERLEKLTGNLNIRLVQDPVFGLIHKINENEDVVGICYQDFVSMGMHNNAFNKLGKIGVEQLILNVILEINKSGKVCSIFTNGDLSDYKHAEEFYNRNKGMAQFNIEDRPNTPVGLIDLISKFSHVISFRMHASIIAHALGKPTMNIVWDDKIEEVWEMVNKKDVPIRIEELLDNSIASEKIKTLLSTTVEMGDNQQVVYESVKECLRGLNVKGIDIFSK